MDALSRAVADQARKSIQADPYAAIRKASSQSGVDFDYLYRTARRESGLNPLARASTSSATGLFQFTNSTWLSMMSRHGERYGVDAETSQADLLALREDPLLSAQMAAELTKENASLLENAIGRKPTSNELYAAHFLGPSGAARLIVNARETPNLKAEDAFPAAARANPSIFNTSAGAPRSVSALYARLTGDSLTKIDAKQPIEPKVALAVQSTPEPMDTRITSAQMLTTDVLMTLLDLQRTKSDDNE